ncbi:MAG TPA: cobalamin-dependent protein [Acidimicrobiales bacterium]|jgi:excisionase family DNA binding protein
MPARVELRLQEAAERLGVHYMTAYRYVRLGLLPARKDGAEWRVRLADLEAFRGHPKPAGRARRAPWAERFESRLLAGDAASAWSVVESALAGGADLAEVYLGVMTPALVCIGERWASGEIDVAAEHRASVIVDGIIGRLAPRFSRRGRTRGTVVIGAVAGERHSIPVAFVADVVRVAGFAVVNLGADVPTASFAVAASESDRLVAVGVSSTIGGRDRALTSTIRAVRRAVRVPVVVGGAGVADDDHARRLGADGWAPDARGAVALLEQLLARDGDGSH